MRTLCACLLALVALAGCGESAEDKAQSSICDSRASIQKEVDGLAGLTPSTVTLDGVKGSLNTIGKDLKQIRKDQGKLKGERKQETQQAWQTFSGQVKEVGGSLLTSLSGADAKQQLTASFDTLASSFRSAFAPVDCSGT